VAIKDRNEALIQVRSRQKSEFTDRPRKTILDYPPLKIQLPITGICNLQCTFCGARQKEYASGILQKRGEIGQWLLDKIGNEVLENITLYLSGEGESLVSNSFWDLISGKRYSKSMTFNTNGILLSQENINKILTYKGELFDLCISLNACSRETYRKLMGVDCFDAVISNMKNLTTAIKNRMKRTKVGISMVVVKENLDEMIQLGCLAKEAGAEFVAVNIAEFSYNYTKDGFCAAEQNLRNDPMLLNKFDKNITELEKRCKEAGVVSICRYGNNEEWHGNCNELFDFLGVLNNGATFACCNGAFISTGNLKGYDTFWDLWNNEKRQKMRAEILNGGFPSECQSDRCPHWGAKKRSEEGNIIFYNTEFSDLEINAEIDQEGINTRRGDSFFLRGKVKNNGNILWSNKCLKPEESFKIGSRIFKEKTSDVATKELRSYLDRDIYPGDTCCFEFRIDTVDLDKGIYFLKLDIVKESSFWFEDKGNIPVILRINVS